ncbi:MAG: hypothetical protein J6R59_01925 [Paludibacteraceae bacterium]|nr:hypothetical protein [Paludibacteraceae bacterium]
MNNFVMFLVALVTFFIGYVQCYNPEDMALFFLACLICVPTIIICIVGIVIDKNFFEM